jgi:hypothetical protein
MEGQKTARIGATKAEALAFTKFFRQSDEG